jgi:hypothetical protein
VPTPVCLQLRRIYHKNESHLRRRGGLELAG